jgi:hypothetical protein
MTDSRTSASKWPEFDAMRAARQMTVNAHSRSTASESERPAEAKEPPKGAHQVPQPADQGANPAERCDI